VPSPVDVAVGESAAPAEVALALERLSEAHPGLPERLAGDEGLTRALVAVTAASRSLTELCLADPVAIEVLADLDAEVGVGEPEAVEDLRAAQRRCLLRVAARDLVGLDPLEVVTAHLADLAAAVLGHACRLAGADDLAVVAMGKLGGRELNYSSDIDVMFVGDDAAPGSQRLARQVLATGGRCYRMDANLRPEGRDGPLVRTLASYEAYWDRWAQTWEFQALVKARPVAGDPALGQAFLAAAHERLWSRPFTAEDLRAVRAMKARAEGELARQGLTDREVKLGRGGLRDIEFAVQLLQLVHGSHDTRLRSPTTLSALAAMAEGGYVADDHAERLEQAYRLLRTVEHRLQLEREQQVHALPTDPAALERLARVLGHRDGPDGTAGEQFLALLRQEQARVRTIHESLFFRPLLDALSSSENRAMTSAAVSDRLGAFGFTHARRTRDALHELTRGLTRSSGLMRQMLPLLLGWLAETPDPDLGLLTLRKLATGTQRATELAVAFRESAESAHRLCVLVGTSRRLGETLERHPDLITALDDEALGPRDEDALAEGARTALTWRRDRAARQRGLLRFRQREELRIAAADVLDVGGPAEPTVRTARQLTDLAEACLRAALATVDPPLPVALVAMGRFGGGELSYASDLDLVVAYDGRTPADAEAATRATEDLRAFLAGDTPAQGLYAVDFDLRPEGRQGPLARSLDGYARYYERWSATWERQALVRARPVAGDPGVAARFMELVEAHVWRPPFPEEAAREVRRMKARVERERIPPGEDPRFHLKLGPGSLSDVEWTAQLLQLTHGVRSPGTMAALEALAAHGALGGGDHAVLAEAYRFCERTRNRLWLVHGAAADALPADHDQLARLARSLGLSTTELREGYRRVTRRARRVVERLFYGLGA